MKTRKLLLIICFTLLFSILLASCVHNETTTINNQELELMDWNDSTEEVVLGSCYDVKLPVAKDSSGQEYPVNVTVIKKENNAVIPLIYDSFDILSLGGYDIKFIASDGEKTATKTVHLTVIDTSKPVVILTGNNIAEKNTKYYFPTINASDNSGEECSISILVTGPSGEQVNSESDGFTPLVTGLYKLDVRATDAFGNVGTACFEVFARDPIAQGEIDALDDEGLEYTSYTLLNSVKQYAKFTTFKHSSISKGSAMFESTKGDYTNIFITPRISAIDINGLGNNKCFSVSIYIADNYHDERTIRTGTVSRIYKTNVWQYITITQDEIGNLGRYSSTMSKGENPLLSVLNEGDTPYNVFIDDVFISNVQSGDLISGLKGSYSSGEAITFNLQDGYVAELWSAGEVTTITSNIIPNHDGIYSIFVHTDNKLDSRYSYTFKVGTSHIDIGLNQLYSINFDNSLPLAKVYDNNQLIENAELSYYDLSLDSNNIEKLNDKVHPTTLLFSLVVKANVSGKKVSNIIFLKSRYTSDEYMYMGNHNGDWAPIISDMRNQTDASIVGAYSNMEVISNFCYHIESYGTAPSVMFTSLKNYMDSKNIDTVNIKFLISEPSKISYKIGEYNVSHHGISYNAGDVLSFDNVSSKDISQVQVIWGTANIYVMVELPNYRTVTSEFVVGDGEITLKDNSSTVFSDCAEYICTVVYPDGSSEIVQNNTFRQKEKGIYQIKYSAKTPNGENIYAVYKLQIGLSIVENASIWDFSDPSIVRNDVKESDGRNYYVEYLEEADKEEGVVAITNLREGDWNWDVRFLSDYTSFADSINDEADTLYVRIKSTNQTRLTIYAAGADPGDSLIFYELSVPQDWITVAISGEKFNHFKNYLSYYRGACAAWIEKPTTIYISEFYVGKAETLTNNVPVSFGEVTLSDNSASVFEGYSKLSLEVRDPDNELVTLTNGTFNATKSGVYMVNYMALMTTGLVKVASYALPCFVKNDLGTYVPQLSDTSGMGWEGKECQFSILDNYAIYVKNINDAPSTVFTSLRTYMQEHGITTVKIRIDCITNTKISIGERNGDNLILILNDGTSGRLFEAGTYYEFTVNLLEFEVVYIQAIWEPCEYIITFDFVN